MTGGLSKRAALVPLVPLVSLVSLACLAAGCAVKPEWYSESRTLYYGIPVAVRFAPADGSLAEAVWEYLEGIDDVFNDYRDDSEIGRVNAWLSKDATARREPQGRSSRGRTTRGGAPLRVSDDLVEALVVSREVNRLTDGAFDVTVGPVRRLWKQATKTGVRPTEADVTRARASCGLDKVKLGTGGADGNTLAADAPGLKLDFGGIIKGIAVDRAVAMLKSGGARAALVQIGGETAAWGISRRGKPHVIGVQHPLHPLDPTLLWTAVADPGTGISVATSGNYRQPVVVGGEVLYHIFDPRTGRPADTRTLSVTVAFRGTGRNGLADGLSTAGAVLGWEKAIPLIEKLGGEALFIVKGTEKESDAIGERKSAGWDALVPDG